MQARQEALKAQAPTLEEFVNKLAFPNPGTWNPTGTDNTFKFRHFRTVADSTIFVVNAADRIVATAAHCVFGSGGSSGVPPKNIKEWYVVFGLTTDHVDATNPVPIPREKIYEIDR